MKISIIVPIYHGKKYILGLIEQIEDSIRNMFCKIQLELVLVNDAPDDDIDELYSSECIDIRVLNTDVNRGIHGARVRGLEHCCGEWVVFLDQDDKIFPNYLESQLQHIQEADAIVCRLIHENKEYYTNSNLFEGVLDGRRMLVEGNQIVSPGQVLLKKSAIPSLWRNNIMKNNGADDWLLWLCMIAENKKFVLNQEVLFEHVVDGNNTSWDSIAMFQSEDEVYEILSKEKKFKDEMLNELKDAIKRKQLAYIRSLEAMRSRFLLCDKWMMLENENGNIVHFFKKRGYRKVAVYGVGELGRLLIGRLCRGKELEVRAIDQNADYIDINVPICKLEDFNDCVDVVVVTLINNPKKIADLIKQRTKSEILILEDVLEMWGRE